jgi:N-acetyl-anhydromuramyl-L-alanine amidase AmpD
MADRVQPHVSYRQVVRNQSERTMRPQLIVVHATQSNNFSGITDLKGVGSWFDNPKSQASAHVCVDDEGHSARFVADSRKAWHCRELQQR